MNKFILWPIVVYGMPADVTTLEKRKRGQPLLVGEDVESYV